MKKQIYLDYNATVPLLKDVKKSLIDCMDAGPLNASSIHYYGRKGKDIIDIARTNIGELIKTNKTNFKGVGQPLRIALTGSKFGPGIYDIIISLGKDDVEKRLTDKTIS